MERVAVGKIAMVGILIVVIAVALVGFLAEDSGGHQTSTVTGIVATTTALPTASASGPMGIEVARTTLDQTTADSQAGDAYYIFDLTLTGNDSAALPSGASHFALTGSSGATYNEINDPAIRQPLPNSSLSTGQQASGQVAFLLPSSDQPAKLEYSVPAQGVDVTVANLPQASRWVTSVAQVTATLPSNSATSNFFATAQIQNFTYGVFYSTDTITVKIEITPYNYDDIVGQAVPDITVTSVTSATLGFTVAGVSPSLPVTVSANGNLAEVDLYVKLNLPSSSLSVPDLELSVSTG
jgi:hypothetical protein